MKQKNRAKTELKRRVAARRNRNLMRRKSTRILLILVAVFSGLGSAGVGVAFAGYNGYLQDLPDAATLAAMEPPMDTHVYAKDGSLLAVFHTANFRHDHVTLQSVSPWVVLGTVDVEDKHYYQEGSADLPRLISATVNDLQHRGNLQGASTITQQLAKKSFLPTAQTIDRKIKEFILGNEIDGNFTKQQILEMYLNRIEFGNHAVGIETAAQVYFQLHASQLDLAQASMLVGLPNSPTQFNPLTHDSKQTVNPLAKQRQKVVLQAMVTNGDISQAQADAAYAEVLTYHYYYESEPYVAPSFLDYLKQWLANQFGDAFITPGGWDITTSLDPNLQNLAQQKVHDIVQANYDARNVHDGAMVVMDPKSAQILAMVGAWDNSDPSIGQLNMAAIPRRPGSSIKLYTYTAAVASHKFTMTSPVPDAPVCLNDGSESGYCPHNFFVNQFPACYLARCLGNSLNIPAVNVEYAVGVPYITNLEIAAGVKSFLDPSHRPRWNNWAATLGGLTYGITPLEQADGVSTIADMGVQHDPMPVIKIVDRHTGKILFADDPISQGHQVIPANVTFIMDEITSNDSNRWLDFGAGGDLTLPDRRVSAKTGTTDFMSDNWTVGWTPDIAAVVWVGNASPSCLKPEDRATLISDMQHKVLYSGQTPDDPFTPAELAAYGLQPINDSCGHMVNSTGITGAAPIWHSFMVDALAGTPAHWFTPPPDVLEQGSGDNGNWYLPGTQGTTCYYYAPAPDPNNFTCLYGGATAPAGTVLGTSASPTPAPTATPTPGWSSPTPSPSP